MKRLLLLAACLVIAASSSAYAQEQTLLLRDPAISATHIAFVYAGDLWISGHDGANPRRLTSDPADESSPVFSPDGSMLAFDANYDGNRDVYVIPISGGQPKRLTWHPGDDRVLDWTPDGSAVAFASTREFNRGRSAQLYHVSINGGLPEKQMEARIFRGRYDDKGQRFAYIAFPPAYDDLYGGSFGWRAHRGGRSPSIAIMDLQSNTVAAIPGDRVNDLEPMWVGDQVYFLSDRDERTLNLFRFDPATGSIERASDEKAWDIRAADAHDNIIVYEAGGRLKTLDTATGSVTGIPISINPDLPQVREQAKDTSKNIESFDLSPTGQRVVFTARGDVITVPVKEGSSRNLSRSDGGREYTALWSPDGSRIAWIDAAKASQDLVIKDQTGLGSEVRFPLGQAFNQLLDWGGDGSRIIYTNQKLELRAIDTSTGERLLISTGSRIDTAQADTSPDGRWLAYTEEKPNYYRALHLYDFASKRSYPVLDDLADVSYPSFSKDGQYLYFAASTNSGAAQSMLDMSGMEKPYRAALYYAVLAADGKSPLAAQAGDEPAASGNGQAEKPDDKPDERLDDRPATTRIDIEGLDKRIGALPVPERNYSKLSVAANGDIFFLQTPQAGASSAPPGQPAGAENTLMRFSLASKTAEQVMSGVLAATVSADGQHILIQKAAGDFMAAEITPAIAPKPLSLADMKVMVEPRREWRQIFDEAWLMEQQYFYDPGMHGMDWQAVYDRYSPLVEHVGRREDLNSLLREMLGEMQVGHQFVYGGDVYQATGSNVGLLGADLAMENGRTRIKRIYTGENWNPFIQSPLAGPGIDVREGDYVLAVNGELVSAEATIWQRLQGTAGKQTVLQVSAKADGSNARNITIEPVASESELRLWAFIEDNRRTVEAATEGRVGYVYVPNTTESGFNFFNRMFYSQVNKQGLIIDNRSNDGGSAANHIVDVLSQEFLSGWQSFTGRTFSTPSGALYGHKVMLIDQDSQSGGDYLAYAFRERQVGPLVGTRTWGGLIGVYINPLMIDGGLVTIPYERFFDTDGNWSVENEGVAPDIRAELDPIASNQGRDTQLQSAIAEIKRMLAEDPPVNRNAPAAPPYPTELGE